MKYNQTGMEIKKKYCEFSPVHASDDTSNDTLRDSPLLDLQTSDPHAHQKIAPPTTPCVTTGLRSANPDPYTHQTTPPTTPCVTVPPATNPQNLRTLTPQLEVRTPIAKAIWGITNIGKGKNIQEIIIHVKHISHVCVDMDRGPARTSAAGRNCRLQYVTADSQ